MIRLTLGSGDAASFRLLFALEEIGLPYEVRKIDLDALEQWSAEARSISPVGAMPLIQADQVVLEESDLALFFLVESNPECGLMPQGAAAIYDCQNTIYSLDRLMDGSGNLLNWLANTDEATQRDYLSRLAATPGRPVVSGWSAVLRDAVPAAERPQAALKNLQQGLDMLEGLLAGNEWLVGEAFSVADIAAVSLVHRLPSVPSAGLSVSERPGIAAWMDKVSQRQGYQKALSREKSEGISQSWSPPQDHE